MHTYNYCKKKPQKVVNKDVEEVELRKVLEVLDLKIQVQKMAIRLPLLLLELQTKYFKKEVAEVATTTTETEIDPT